MDNLFQSKKQTKKKRHKGNREKLTSKAGKRLEKITGGPV